MKRWIPLLAVVATMGSMPPTNLRADDQPAGDAGFETLWNGKDLTDWKIGKNADSWSVKDGELVVHGPGPGHLFYVGPVHEHDFKNFHLKAEVLTFPHANSGIYFHTTFQEEGWPAQGFEAQVNQSTPTPKRPAASTPSRTS